MTSYIRATAERSIFEGKVDEFKQLASKIIERVEKTEPSTISYEWFLSHDGSKCYVVQIYKDSNAGLFHLRNIADLLGPFYEIAPLTELKIFGNPSVELRLVLEPIGAQIFESLNGIPGDK